jgi:hypothetical protein
MLRSSEKGTMMTARFHAGEVFGWGQRCIQGVLNLNQFLSSRMEIYRDSWKLCPWPSIVVCLHIQENSGGRVHRTLTAVRFLYMREPPCNATQGGYFLSVQSMMLTRCRFGLVLHRGDRAAFRHLETNHQVQLLRSKAGCTRMSFGRPSSSERRTAATIELYAPEIHGACHYITGYVLVV